jgi:hypothetical protein
LEDRDLEVPVGLDLPRPRDRRGETALHRDTAHRSRVGVRGRAVGVSRGSGNSVPTALNLDPVPGAKLRRKDGEQLDGSL